MGADQIAVERRSDVDHVLVERREALALRLRADRKDRDPLEAEVFLLLEQQGWEKRSRTHSDMAEPSLSTRKSVLSIATPPVPVGMTT